ncbi:MAG: hypothetical protein HQ581_10150 [Planctomycetes bacterium]|nr:hypothetical protein [Planctomycetota bacterium]
MSAPHSPHPDLTPHTSDFRVAPLDSTQPASLPGTSQPLRQRTTPRAAEALRMWLRWNEAHEQLTAQMFQAGSDPARLDDLAEQVDQLRRQAVAASHEVLHRPVHDTPADSGASA